MDVPEFTEMVKNIRLVEKALGSYIKRPVPAEDETISIQRRCIYSKEDIPKGTIITRNMLTLLRPDKGLKPKFMSIVVGRRAQKDIPKGTAIIWDMI
jgi:sialic acid synthase SpsE